MIDFEGEITIDLADFMKWVLDANPMLKDMEVVLGVPRVKDDCLIVSVAASSNGNPADWEHLPLAVTEWKELRNKGS